MEARGQRDQSAAVKDRQHWRLAAVLFFGGGLGAIPSDALHQPAHPATVYLLPLLALISGTVCWLVSTRLAGRWLHVMAVVATIEVALTVALADDVFAIYYVFVAVFSAYVFESRAAIGAQIGFASLAALAPIVYEPETARETLIQGFALIPTLVLAGGAVTLLRERLKASEELHRQLAERDHLTGVGNYRMLMNRLPLEVERHWRYERSLSIVVVDLDDFKRVNDLHGHQHGDRVLEEVGRVLRDSVRSIDTVVRQGGDEFCVLAPDTDREHGEQLATRVREALARIAVDETPLGACTGLAVFPEDAGSAESLLASADARLREAKGQKEWRSRSGARGTEQRGENAESERQRR